MRSDFNPDDYSVVVKLRGGQPSPWKWEIYCAGKQMPVERSTIFFQSRGTAHSAGKEALAKLIEKLNY